MPKTVGLIAPDPQAADTIVITPADVPPPESPTKTTKKKSPVVANRHAAYAALRAEGMSAEKAAQALGLHPRTGYQLDKKLSVYDKLRDSLLRDSVKAVKKLVKGEPFGSIEKVKDSTALAAAGMILDREVPKVNLNQNINVNLEFLPINLDDYA